MDTRSIVANDVVVIVGVSTWPCCHEACYVGECSGLFRREKFLNQLIGMVFDSALLIYHWRSVMLCVEERGGVSAVMSESRAKRRG